jgi:hypothetical protein
LKNVFIGAGAVMGVIFYLIIGITGLLIHLWTIIISLTESGIVGALATLVFPGLAEIYWAIVAWSMTGTFANTYTLTVVGYAALFVVLLCIAGIVGYFSSKSEQEPKTV